MVTQRPTAQKSCRGYPPHKIDGIETMPRLPCSTEEACGEEQILQPEDPAHVPLRGGAIVLASRIAVVGKIRVQGELVLRVNLRRLHLGGLVVSVFDPAVLPVPLLT